MAAKQRRNGDPSASGNPSQKGEAIDPDDLALFQ
jgi:hypothetical protein